MSEEKLIEEGIPSLPFDLKEALNEMVNSEVISDALGARTHLYELKEIKWDMYRTQWERDHYIRLY